MIEKTCPGCGKAFSVPTKNRKQRCCSKTCHGHWCAVRRPDGAYKRMGKLGGKLSGKTRRQDAARKWLRLLGGPMQPAGVALYLIGYMHGQNTRAMRSR